MCYAHLITPRKSFVTALWHFAFKLQPVSYDAHDAIPPSFDTTFQHFHTARYLFLLFDLALLLQRPYEGVVSLHAHGCPARVQRTGEDVFGYALSPLFRTRISRLGRERSALEALPLRSSARIPKGRGRGSRSSHPGLLPEAWPPDADARRSRFEGS
jgi:hypothetical protein